MYRILVTGGLGFIGHHFVEHIIRYTNWNIIIIDKLTYASKGFDRLRSSNLLHSDRLTIYTYNLCSPLSDGLIKELGDIHYIVHMAAETHVDNSIANPIDFMHNNIMSTIHMFEYGKKLNSLIKFFYFSTDEIYGSAPNGISYKETDPMNPTNPYSASKAAGENIALAYENTYKLPIIIVNCMNAMGERQHIEKFIPKCIDMINKGETISIHSDPTCTISGSRSYIHARNIASAVLFLIKNGNRGEKYNITGEKEISNLDLALTIGKIMNKKVNYEMVNFHASRPGHDLEYRLDGTKLKNLGWICPVTFEESLRKTVEWTLNNSEWLIW